MELNEAIFQRDGILRKKELRGELKKDEIIKAIAEYYEMDPDIKVICENGLKSTCLYLIKKHTGMTNRKIGEMLGGMNYSAVSKAYQRYSAKLNGDRSLRKMMRAIENKMSHVEA